MPANPALTIRWIRCHLEGAARTELNGTPRLLTEPCMQMRLLIFAILWAFRFVFFFFVVV